MSVAVWYTSAVVSWLSILEGNRKKTVLWTKEFVYVSSMKFDEEARDLYLVMQIFCLYSKKNAGRRPFNFQVPWCCAGKNRNELKSGFSIKSPNLNLTSFINGYSIKRYSHNLK